MVLEFIVENSGSGADRFDGDGNWMVEVEIYFVMVDYADYLVWIET